MRYQKLLMDEYPLLVLPALAVAIGLHEAIFLQQLNYWMNPDMNQGIIDENGRRWIYNSASGWARQFPFFSERTLRRTISNLENLGLIVSTTRFKKHPMDRTKAYSICYENVEHLERRPQKPRSKEKSGEQQLFVAPVPEAMPREETQAKGQSQPTMRPNWPYAKNKASEDVSSDSMRKGQTRQTLVCIGNQRFGQIGQRCGQIGQMDAARLAGCIRPPQNPCAPTPGAASLARAREDYYRNYDRDYKKAAAKKSEIVSRTRAAEEESDASLAAAPLHPDLLGTSPSPETETPVTQEVQRSVHEAAVRSLAEADQMEKAYLARCAAHGVNEADAKRFRLRFGEARVLEKLPMLKMAQKAQEIQNPLGWLYRALEHDYQRPHPPAQTKLTSEHEAAVRRLNAQAQKSASYRPLARVTSIEDLRARLDSVEQVIREAEEKGEQPLIWQLERDRIRRNIEAQEAKNVFPGGAP